MHSETLSSLAGRLMRVSCLTVLLAVAGGRLYGQSFTQITGVPPVNDGGASRGVAWIDYDQDGYLDLFVTNFSTGTNVLYHNDGPPLYTFTKMSGLSISQVTAPSAGTTWGDYNNDGYPDAFIANWGGVNNLLYRNDGTGDFTQILTGDIVNDHASSAIGSWGDYDNDGNLDLFVTNSASPNVNFLYHNLGDGSFETITTAPPVTIGGPWLGASWIDYDGDGDQDLFLVRNGGGNCVLFKNMLKETGTATFVQVTTGALVNSGAGATSGAWGDYDNDGKLDVYLPRYFSTTNLLFHNDGNGNFTAIDTGIAVSEIANSNSAVWVDVDNDGDLDLFVTHGWNGAQQTNVLYKNMLMETGVPWFQKVTTGPLVSDAGYSFGCSWGDYDEDGFPDLYVAKSFGGNQDNALFHNNGNGNHWLTLDCVGVLSNRSGIGTVIRAKATIGGKPVWQMRVVEGVNNLYGQNPQSHFGLGDAVSVDSLVIAWPSGATDVYTNVSANRHVCCVEQRVIVPQLMSPADGTIAQSDTVTLRWNRDLCGKPYHVQIATDSTFGGIVYEDSTVTDTVKMVTQLPNDTKCYWRIQPTRTIDRSAWSVVRSFLLAPSTFAFQTDLSWNILSVPLHVSDTSAAVLFPGAISPAYRYNGSSYTAQDTLTIGTGYWIRCQNGLNATATGTIVFSDTISVDSGWNLIGSLSYPIAAASVTSLPPDIVESKYFGWNGYYTIDDSLLPWRGYWVKAQQAGQLVLTLHGEKSHKQSVSNVFSKAGKISFEDRNGHSQTLYVIEKSNGGFVSLENYCLPPLPPEGAFDIRFSSGRFLDQIDDKNDLVLPILVRGAAYPLEVRWEIPGRFTSISLTAGETRIPLSADGRMKISSEEGLLQLVSGSSGSIPKEYGLLQNYPNPFNPTTTIKYQLPTDSRVKLDVYNILGQLVARLVDETQSAGFRQVGWNASNVGSGVYICQIHAVNVGDPSRTFTSVKKMLLIK